MAWRWFRYTGTVLETGYPLTDALYAPDPDEASELRESLRLPEGKRVMLYAPTWREMDRFDMMLNLDKLRSALSDEYVLLVRPYHFVSEFYTVPEDGEFIFDANHVEKIEDLFAITDVLITDYSSVMFDFALTGKPMVFFAYDLDEYTKEDRGSYFKIEDEAPGALAKTTAEVIDAVKASGVQNSADSARTEAFIKKYLTYETPYSAEKVFDAVFVRDIRKERITVKDRVLSAAGRILPGRIAKKIRRYSARRRLYMD
jgi:CDP-glycerol glycerophosphotransferase